MQQMSNGPGNKGPEQNGARGTPTAGDIPDDDLIASITVAYPRGATECLPGPGNEHVSLPLAALVPADQVGRTRQEQPSLQWYLPSVTPCPVMLTVIDDRPGKPLLEVTLPPPRSLGVQRVRWGRLGNLPGRGEN
jgi:hypothetical protein